MLFGPNLGMCFIHNEIGSIHKPYIFYRDLYGAVGSPTKVCRTIVTGSCHEVVSTFLSLISYFIRSSRVDEVIDVPSDITPSVSVPHQFNLDTIIL